MIHQAHGNTLLLTTQYSKKADELATRSRSSATSDHRPRPADSSRPVGGERIEASSPKTPLSDSPGRGVIAPEVSPRWRTTKRITLAAHGGAQQLVDVVRSLGDAGIALDTSDSPPRRSLRLPLAHGRAADSLRGRTKDSDAECVTAARLALRR